MIKHLMGTAFFLVLTAASAGTYGSIASTSASYDGSRLILDGNVSVEHGFGTMKAGKAILTRQQEDSAEFPFASIELAEAVHLDLSTHAQIECERASLDFGALKGTLCSPQHVHYIDALDSTPFELFSPHIDLQMTPSTQKKEAYDIEKVHAQKGVHLIYNQLYHLHTESILFANQRLQSEGNACRWTYENSRVDGEKFDLDLAHNHLYLQKAKGHLTSFSKGELQFTADSLSWTHTDNHLCLKGSPQVEETSLGTITSSQEIHLFLKDHKLDKLKTAGFTQLTSGQGHTLTTEGAVEIEGDKCLATLSPCSKQLCYQEEELSLMADAAQIHYREDENRLYPERVELQGHIKIFSQDKRAIADTLTYNPQTRHCLLKGLPGHKVLFTRHQDQMRMSANEVHITYDPLTQEQQVKGIGSITLSFSPEEQKFLNQVFGHDSSSP